MTAAKRSRKNRGRVIRVATLNTLGASHTDNPKGNKWRRWLRSRARMTLLAAVMRYRRPHVIGLQEFQRTQAGRWRFLLSKQYDTFAVGDNAIAIRRRVFRFVHTSTFAVPYFSGHMKKMPIAVLEHRKSGTRLVFVSAHNPASVRGDASAWRHEGWAIEDAFIEGYCKTHGVELVIAVADRNAKSDKYEPHVPAGTVLLTKEVDPGRDIDHIAASVALVVVRVRAFITKRLTRATDHPLVMTWLRLPKETP